MSARRPSRQSALLLAAAMLATAPAARAAPCPNVLFVLDNSASMADSPGGGGGKSKWLILQDTVELLLDKWGDKAPMGLSIFSSKGNSLFDTASCWSDTKIDIEPDYGTASNIRATVLGTRATGSSTNTGDAVKRVRTSVKLRDPKRGQFVILISDGEPNCNKGEPTLTVTEIEKAAAQTPSIHTFVIGFDGNGGFSPDTLNKMAVAGKEPRHPGACSAGNPCFYSATNEQELDMAMNTILTKVISGGEFATETVCDDSCLSNGCAPGEICAADELSPDRPTCRPNPCLTAGVCAPGLFCREGTCVPACNAPCPGGTRCVDGTCLGDKCWGVVCPDGEACGIGDGKCHKDPCAGVMCKVGQYCSYQTGGVCFDEPCRLLTCPSGYSCKLGGNCEADLAPGGDPGEGGGRSGGCSATGATRGAGGAGGIAAGLGALALLAAIVVLARRRAART